MKNYFLILILFLSFHSMMGARHPVFGPALFPVQDSLSHHPVFGFSLQYYPAGVITSAGTAIYLKPHSSLSLRLGTNFIDRRDFSPENDHESGFGFGAGAGYQKHYFFKKGNWLAALNTDIYHEWIHWNNHADQVNASHGRTYTLVVQPWLETGYFTGRPNYPAHFGLTAGFGREFNVITKGKAVGQGWIGSILFHAQFVFKNST